MATRSVRAVFTLSLLLAPAKSVWADTYRVTCSDIVGSRIQHSANPSILPDEYGKTKVEDDAVSGMIIDVTFSFDHSDASVVMHGNKNTEGRVFNHRAISVNSEEIIDFFWIDSWDGSHNMMSYLRRVRECLWSVHNDNILQVEQIAIGKLFICSCSENKI